MPRLPGVAFPLQRPGEHTPGRCRPGKPEWLEGRFLKHHKALRTLIEGLLAHAARGTPIGQDVFPSGSAPDAEAERQFRWLLRAGLGPLLHHMTRSHAAALPARWRDELLAADLTARVRHADLVESAIELIETCRAQGITVTLLKGISVSEQFYPAEHLRPMADIDVLFPRHLHQPVIAALSAPEGGYDNVDPPADPRLHHDAPLRHRARDTIVELHTDLFPRYSPLTEGQVFGVANIARQSMPSGYHSRPVRRLSPEFQLVYMASSCFNDLTLTNIDPSFLASVVDAAYLLRRFGETLDWSGMREWIDNDLAKGSLYALLTYLPRFGAEPAPGFFVDWLARSQQAVGATQLRFIHWMLDRYLVGGRPWRFVFPPPVPGRYSPLHQVRKRIFRLGVQEA